MSERLEFDHTGQTLYDVAIVGGGMVGSALACALDGHGLKVALFDAGSKPEQTPAAGIDPRVCALTEASRQLFTRLDVWADMTANRVCPYQKMQVWDGDGTGSIQFGAQELHQPWLGHIVENNVIQAALNKRLASSDVTCIYGNRLKSLQSGFPARLTLDNNRQYTARLVVGADGAESSVRKQVGIPLVQRDCLHHAMVTTITTTHHHNDTAWQRFTKNGPVALLPLPDIDGQHRCSVVWSQLPEKAGELMQLDDQAFCQALTYATESCLGEITSASKRYSYPLRHRHTRSYFSGSAVLVGDAAHTIHPLAGQGVNLGLLDVAVLVEELLHAYKRGDDIARSGVLARYQRRRMGDNLAMLGAMEGFQHLFGADALPVRWLRNTGLKLTNRIPEVKHKIIRRAMGLDGDLPLLCRSMVESSAV